MESEFVHTPPPPDMTSDQSSELSSESALKSEAAKARALMDEATAATVLPEGTVVTGLTKDFFQSRAFRAVAYNAMPEQYGNADRSLTTLTLETGAQVFVLGGRVSGNNPFEVGHAATGGLDLRKSRTVVYAYDGEGAITEYGGGEANVYTGEYGTPEALLPHVRKNLGMHVGSETFGL